MTIINFTRPLETKYDLGDIIKDIKGDYLFVNINQNETKWSETKL